MKKGILLVLITLVFLTGCVGLLRRSSNLKTLSLGMSKADVLRRIGNPTAVKGGFKNDYEQTIEVWEYDLYNPKDFSGSYPERYWVVFAEGSLAKYDLAGDWRKEENTLMKTQFK